MWTQSRSMALINSKSGPRSFLALVVVTIGVCTLTYIFGNRIPSPSKINWNRPVETVRQLIQCNEKVVLTSTTLEKNIEQVRRQGNVLDGEGCFIPNISHFDPSILQFVRNPGPLNCGDDVRLTYTSYDRVHVNRSVANLTRFKGKIHHCAFRPIVRPKYIANDHNYYKYLTRSKPFKSVSEKVKDEYIRVKCYDVNENVKYVGFHTFMFTNSSLKAIYNMRFENHTKSRNPKESLNVIFVGIDSISKSNFLRTMPKTYALLKSRLHLLEFEGFTNVGYCTFDTTIPLLTGTDARDYNKKSLPFDNVQNRTLWYQFQRAGYMTFYAEDNPSLTSFDYKRKGFLVPPTDVFNRPYILAANDAEEIWSHYKFCALNRSQIQLITEHLLQFHDFNTHEPVFSFTFLTRVTHDQLHNPKKVDHIYADLFRTMNGKGHFDKSVFIFWSDHGMRFGGIRETYVGRHEWKRPFMFMAFPDWFQSAYQGEWENLVTNQRRLIGPHDIHISLLDILYLNTNKPYRVKLSTPGRSLLKEVPRDRTCKDAGIPPNLCPCLSNVRVDVSNSTETDAAAEFIVNYINMVIVGDENSLICHELKLDKVLTADLENKTGEQKDVLMTLTVKAQPGNAVFEGSVVMISGKPSNILGDLNRISMYKGQDACVKERYMKNFCVCKSLVKIIT